MVSTHQKKSGEAQKGRVEQGHVYFVYRPRIGEEQPEGLSDIQRFYMVLKPDGASRFRVAVIGRKRLPEADGHERLWGFIETVAESGSEVGETFRGERNLPAARLAGEGVYALTQRGRNLHLAYELNQPEQPGDVQNELNIEQQAAYILSIKNPKKPSPPGAGLPTEDKADYPEPLQQEFGGRRFIAGDPRLLDYQGAEFILISTGADPERELGVDMEAEHKKAGEADVFRALKLKPGEHPPEPPTKDEWR